MHGACPLVACDSGAACGSNPRPFLRSLIRPVCCLGVNPCGLSLVGVLCMQDVYRSRSLGWLLLLYEVS